MVDDALLVTVSGRVTPSAIPRLDRIAAALTARVPGSKLRRSDALRAAIERGVEVLEAELGIAHDAPLQTAPQGRKGAKRPARKPAKK